ncbi:MAG: DUF1501 domain-containing protein [Armatimonadetes bacterium]|nr:DUF1501 domain-containing protein [Armatimonadota bacterium]
MITRRAFMKTGGLALFTVGIGGSPQFLARAASAATPSKYGRRAKILVTIFQRGAMDGLMAVTPYNDPNLRNYRPRLLMAPGRGEGGNALLDLDGRFGLHPAFAPLAPFYQEKRLAVVHGVGSPDPTRSHFDAQDYMETGTPGRKGTPSGWLNRAIGLKGHEGTPFQAVSMTSALPRSLYGDRPALAVARLEDFGVQSPGGRQMAPAALNPGRSFEALYEQTSQELLRGTGKESFQAIKMLNRQELRSYRPENGAAYPTSPLGNSLRQIAFLIKSGVGLEVAFAETGGWDTHVQQGTNNGSFANRSRDLAQAITAFWTDLGSYQDEVTLMTMTEFGRTVRENGSAGTDHGRGSCLFVLGNNVDGGKMHGKVPELAPEALEDGRDLPVTTDFRAVFSEVAGKHLGIAKDRQLFPGYTGERLPLIKA